METIIKEFSNSGNTFLSRVVIPSGVQEIGAGAYHNCSNLTSVVIPKTVKCVRQGAFSSCPKLSKVVYEAGTVFEPYCFNNCPSLQTIVESGKTFYLFYLPTDMCYIVTEKDGVQDGDEMFHGCIYYENELLSGAPNSLKTNYVVVSHGVTTGFWFSRSLEIATVAARWVASDKSFVDYFGFELTDDTPIAWEQLSLLLGVCEAGRLLWHLLARKHGYDPEAAIPLGKILQVLQHTEPIMYKRLRTMVDKQHVTFNWLHKETLLSGTSFAQHMRDLYSQRGVK